MDGGRKYELMLGPPIELNKSIDMIDSIGLAYNVVAGLKRPITASGDPVDIAAGGAVIKFAGLLPGWIRVVA